MVSISPLLKSRPLWVTAFVLFGFVVLMAQHTIVFQPQFSDWNFQKETYQKAVANSGDFDVSDIEYLQFKPSGIPQINHHEKILFTKFKLRNLSDKKLYLEVAYPAIENLKLFHRSEGADEYMEVVNTGYGESFDDKLFSSSNFILPLPGSLDSDKVNEYVIMAYSESPVFLPLTLRTRESVQQTIVLSSYIYGLYLGVFLALLLYNLFILLATRDSSYIPYLFFLVFVALAQSAISGYGYKYFWPNSPSFNVYAIPVFSALAGIAGLVFARMFLRIDYFFRSKWTKISFTSLETLYALSAILALIGWFSISYDMLNVLAIIGAVFLLVVALKVVRKGYTPAIFYFVAWSVFLVSLLVLALRNFSILPFNNFTNNITFIGAAAEVILLSLALADKINVMRKETQESQAEALRVSRENERIIREQNLMLEQKVHERTLELQEANEELKVTLTNLRDTQTQLVDAEKMASLGQLTAGIAHEINNPINFVTSNIGPLVRDLDEMYEIMDAYAAVESAEDIEALTHARQLRDEYEFDYLKEEISSLVNGIKDGASRTSEIVKGLRTFSRLDEDVLKQADVHEGLSSTLVLLRSKMKDGIDVEFDYDQDMPMIDCMPGKLNQVFMNILNNAIYAVQHKTYAEEEQPVISLSTRSVDSEVSISIKDNGIGMNEETRKKMFDPFFTTKEVGEGTGLGMSIVYKIIEKHRGRLDVRSELGVGTEFIINLPVRQPNTFE